MEDLFLQLTAVVVVTVLVVLAAKILSQPAIIAYILSGIVVGPLVLGYVKPASAIELLGHIGVIFLLFIVGLGIKPKLIREVGWISLITGVGQIIFTSVLGFILANWLGYPLLTSLYLSVAFTFSSTIIVLQLLYSKEENETLYGRISIGFLLVQDFAAMIVFLLLASFSPGTSLSDSLVMLSWRVIAVGLAVYVLMRWIMPGIEKKFERSRETIFLFGLAVCFLFSSVFAHFGFSKELGALFAGVVLSTSSFHRDIAARLSPLRDFFLLLFFVSLGTSVAVSSIFEDWPLILIFSLFILIGNPFIVILLMKPLNYTLATSFYAGLTVAQISEFSLILLTAGASLGHVPASAISSATIVGLITMFCSSYMIMNNKKLFLWFEPILRPIFGPDRATELNIRPPSYSVIIFGSHRLGGGITEALLKTKTSFLVVDHDPETVQRLAARGIPHLLGSANDSALLDFLPLRQAKTIISTVPDVEVNLTLVEHIRRISRSPIILCVANHVTEASQLYKAGVSFVIMPPLLGRRFIVDLIVNQKLSRRRYAQEKVQHLKDIAQLSKLSL